MGTAAGKENCVLLWGSQWGRSRNSVREEPCIQFHHLTSSQGGRGRFPCRCQNPALLSSHLFHSEGNVPENGNSLLAHPCKVLLWFILPAGKALQRLIHRLAWLDSGLRIYLIYDRLCDSTN